MDKVGNPWSVPVAAEDIPDSGLHVDLDAPADIRAAVAALANVRDLPRLTAAFDLTRRGGGVHVAGAVSATVGQTCVVSLEPMETEVNETVDLLFTPEAGEERAARQADADTEPPEPLVNSRVDLGAIATEFLILGIDPYPRKPGAAFAAPKSDDAGAHPFAALAALKKPPGDGRP
jgi:uncharacterized metal-binding protein YceD (DUF177 family)